LNGARWHCCYSLRPLAGIILLENNKTTERDRGRTGSSLRRTAE
jgi:hypothetical protein